MDLFLEMLQKYEQFENRMLTMDIFNKFLEIREVHKKCIKNLKPHNILASSYHCIDLLRRNYQCDIAAYGPTLQ